jgi:hypothetical protein
MDSDLNREFGSVYQYMSPTNMPGVRHLCGVPFATHYVNNLDTPYVSYQTVSNFPSSCGTLGPNWVPPTDLPIIKKRKHVDAENFMRYMPVRQNKNLTFRDILIIIIILCIIVTVGMYFLDTK